MKNGRYSPEVREQSVRMVFEQREQHKIDHDKREGVTTTEAKHGRALKREVKAQRRANEILKLASAFSRRRSSTAD